MNIDKQLIAKRKQILESASKQLKSEFFGLDLIIDKIISAVYSWFVFPELITRPVIINLWGMTGLGKTQVVRRLTSLLNFGDQFVEIQMDGTSNGEHASICSHLVNFINEKTPGILLLDEMQRFRTRTDDGLDVKVERYTDVWTLLSDGKFAPNTDMFLQLEMLLAERMHDEHHAENSDNFDRDAYNKKPFKIYAYTARNIKKTLRLHQPINEIMSWSLEQLQTTITKLQEEKQDWLIDYSKLLIFISGNLDSVFTGAISTEDSDTDADYYNQITSKLSITEIKQALGRRFRPEQISRFGGTHIIYPSMSKSSYEKLIKSTCEIYVAEISASTKIKFTLSPEIFKIIYTNSVYPTQGTRPVFSAIHKIFSTGLVNIACWGLETDNTEFELQIDEKNQLMIGVTPTDGSFSTPIDLDISDKKSKISQNMKTLVAVHEAGHAVVYAILTNSAPIETKINASSFANGYMLPNEGLNTNNITTKMSLRNKMAIALAGMVAEEIIFGEDNRSNGCSSDVKTATLIASTYVREYGYDTFASYVENAGNHNVAHNTDLASTNTIIETILQEEKERTRTLILANNHYYMHIVDKLLSDITIDQPSFIEASKSYVQLDTIAYVNNFEIQYNDYKEKMLTLDNKSNIVNIR